MTAEPLADLTRVRDHSHDPAVVDWLDGSTDVLPAEIVTAELVEEPPASVEEMVGILGRDWTGGLSSVEFVRRQRDRAWLPPVGWVPVNPDASTPVFDAVQDGWTWRTVKGRKSRLTLSFDAYVAASRVEHSTWHGRQT